MKITTINSAATSVLAFGWYLVVEGIFLMTFPNIVLGVIGLPNTTEVWIRVVGWAVVALGYYYINAARENYKPFFRWTVHIRLAQFLVFCAFVLVQWVSPAILIFSAVEALAGIWTLVTLRPARA